MLNRSAIMRHAWKLYRASLYGSGPFDREAFSRGLKMAWSRAKLYAQKAADEARREAEEAAELAAMAAMADADDEADEPSALEQAIANTAYLPFHMSAAAAEARIRADFAARGIYA